MLGGQVSGGAYTEEPPAAVPSPPHILVTEEMVKRALDAYDLMAQDIEADEGDEAQETEERSMRAALSAVVPEVYEAGMRAGLRIRPQA